MLVVISYASVVSQTKYGMVRAPNYLNYNWPRKLIDGSTIIIEFEISSVAIINCKFET